MYDASNEHDACGVGMLVNIHGDKSHELVDSALKVLENMKHRGAEGADNKTGDGAGIMLQIPHEFILLQGIPVPEKGKYGTGLVFLPKDGKEQELDASFRAVFKLIEKQFDSNNNDVIVTLACLFIRNAFLIDHKEAGGKFRYALLSKPHHSYKKLSGNTTKSQLKCSCITSMPLHGKKT